MKSFILITSLCVTLGFLISCSATEKELTADEIIFQKKEKSNSLLSRTIQKPGGKTYSKGHYGGVWMTSINNDPKSFNTLNARDGDTAAVTEVLMDSLLDYDVYKKEWKPNLASYAIKTNDKTGSMDIFMTLRDDLFWTTLADSNKKVPVTSDDVVYWYDQIEGDPDFQNPGYPGQFQTLPDGSKKRITIEKIDSKNFIFHYPKIVAMPELSCNMNFGPRYIFEPVKRRKGVSGVLALWSVDTDPKSIPTIGPYYIAEYKPGTSVVLQRNPFYWKKDSFGQTLPYIDRIEMKILPNVETEKLKFLAGELESYSLRPEDLQEFVNKDPRNYKVYYKGPNLGASFITWNQNSKNLAPKYVKWFSQTQFRQAMSCFFNRDRVVDQIYRGLAEPALYFFAKPNPFFDASIKQQFTYNPQRGKELLAQINIKPDSNGIMRDSNGNIIEFDILVANETNIAVDMATIYRDELQKVGIKLNVKPVDFQKMVDSIIKTYDWQSIIVSLGENYFPTQGSNVWQSSGNFHIWNPLQKKPATEWESKIDQLYQEGSVTLDKTKSKKIWDEFQKLLLDQVPLMYTVNPDGFLAVNDKWGNVYADNLNSPDRNYIYLHP